MRITFETHITSDSIIKLPDELRDLADHRVSVTITAEIDGEADAKKAKIMNYAGIWSDLSDEDAQQTFGRTQLSKTEGFEHDGSYYKYGLDADYTTRHRYFGRNACLRWNTCSRADTH